MHTKYSIKKLVILEIISLLVVGLINPNVTSILEIDAADGVWTDNFENDDDVNLTDCHIENDAIVLNKGTNKITYDFTDGKSHEAYSYVTPFFFQLYPPDFHIRREYKLQEFTGEIYKIKYKDLIPIYYSRSSTWLKRYVVHHFRFNLDAKAEDIGNLIVNWSGKATDDNQIKLFYWKYFYENKGFGFWIPLNYTQSQGSYIDFSATIPKDNIERSLSKDNFLDICVVANPKSTTCTLYTDYVEIISEIEEGYKIGYGTARVKEPIDPKTISNVDSFYWELLTWEDYERGGATVKYHVLYENETGECVLVEDEYLEGNEEGLTDPPIYLNYILYDKLKIMANLSTNTFLVTPKIFSWAVTWQTDINKWQDLFNYTFRIDEKNNVRILDGTVSLRPVSNGWPLLHQNPQNTRSTEGKGPEGDDFNWFSIIGDEKDEEILNPVIRDGVLYTSYLTSTKLYYIPDISVIRDEEWQTPNYDKDFGNDKWLVSSPAITEDYIIIATGKADIEGTSNYVIALDRTDFTEKWKFVYNGDLCYYSSPVVYNDKVFVTSWSGDPDFLQSNKNNKVIALDLSSGSQLWEYDLPAGSFSTPAVYKNTVFVGCNKRYGDSLFAIDAESGDYLWSNPVGAIGRTSPVIYNDTVFIVSKGLLKIKVIALSAVNGNVLWTKIVCYSIFASADSTPAVFDDVVYLASPNGWVFALDVEDGNEIWSKKVYLNRWFDFLVTSPTYADGVVYIGTPAGTFYAIDASDGKKKWDFQTFDLENPFNTPPIVTSPVVSNGLVFFGDNNGYLYSIGSYQESDKDMEGSIISSPIYLPSGYLWNRFYANYNISYQGSNIIFSLLDEDKNFIKEINNGGNISLENEVIRLSAYLYAENVSVNPELFDWSVTFSSKG